MSLGVMKGMDLTVVPYGRSIKAEGGKNIDDDAVVVDSKPVEKSSEPPVEPVVMNPKPASKVKYRECMKNHAASIGGHANDGCGEFMPASAACVSLTCAACGCHRNFHRKEDRGGLGHNLVKYSPPPPMLLYNSGATKIGGFTAVVPGLALPQHSPHPHPHHRSGGLRDVDLREYYNDEDKIYDRRSETPEGGDVQVGATSATARNKRFRTRFTQEQKERMLEFAERSGWRIQKKEDVALIQFCSEVGVKRNVLKVWMHNNKNAHRSRETAPASPPGPPPPQPPAPPQAVVGV